jgi:hypothetical protein
MQFSESTPPPALHATFGAHKFAAPHEGEIEFLIIGEIRRSKIYQDLCGEASACTCVWMQDWVQLEKKKWLRISRKRHRHLDFSHSRPLTEGVLVRISLDNRAGGGTIGGLHQDIRKFNEFCRHMYDLR